MGEGNMLRLFAFRPARSDAAFETILCDEVLPGLLALPGLVDAFVGGHGEMLPNTGRPPVRIRAGARAGAVK